jgi:hypothetical protein
MNPRPTTCHGLLRAMLRQPQLTSDALLVTADALDTWTDVPAAQDVARLMRVIAPCYAAVPLEAAAPSPHDPDEMAGALVQRFDVRTQELAALVHQVNDEEWDRTTRLLLTILLDAARARDVRLRDLTQRFAVHPE